MALQKFVYYENKKKRIIQVKPCNSFLSKAIGLMFKTKSLPLLFSFAKEKTLFIHSYFCRPFSAIWLDKNKRVTKKEEIRGWFINISGRGKYLLEIPHRNKRAFERSQVFLL